MARELVENFSSLDGDSKVKSLLSMVKLCSYQQQLQFVELLQEHLHKDFITLLPDHLMKKVLSYLSVQDAIRCTLVSKNWNRVVGSCTSFWNYQAQQLGLSDSFIDEQLKIPCFKGLKDLCVSAFGHQNYIRSLSPHSMVISKNPSSPNSLYRYAGNGITLRYKELNGHAQVFVEQIISPHSIVEMAVFTVESFSGRIKWASSCGDYVLWKQVDGKWNGCDTTSIMCELEQWVDEPVSQGFHSISFCHHCHLIAIVSEAEDDIEVWDLQVIKLGKGKSTVRKMVYPIPLERVQGSWQKKRHFLGGDVTLLSESSELDVTGFCQSHRVLLQVDSKLVIHRLKAVPVTERLVLIHHLLPDARLSKPLHVFSPQTNEEPLDFMDFQVSKGRPVFCYSLDHTHVALVQESYLYVWSLESLKEESCVDLLHYNLPTDCKCIALGSLYAVLASDSHGTCYVVLVRSGEILLQSSSADSYFNPEAQRAIRFRIFPPIKQQWLNVFHYTDFWPIALVFDYFNSIENPSEEHQLKALIGMQSHQHLGVGLSFK